jgi:GNAT superfamily N-acetyltransferase
MSLPIKIREVMHGDEAFIFSSWIKSYRDSIKELGILRPIRPDIYYSGQHIKIEEIIKRGATILIASEEEDPTQIYGWVCFEGMPPDAILHFVYVKANFRRMGLGSTLINEAIKGSPAFFTHDSIYADYFKGKLPLTYNPFLV